jgi:hypothetical protein
VLETSAAADDPQPPGWCLDAPPVQGLKETRVPSAATRTPGRRVDDEDARHGPASLFMVAEPLSGFRHATARRRRTNTDGASDVAHLVDTRSAHGADVPLVCDHLNTHTQGAFYEAFAPARARAYIQRIHLCDTPQPGRWLHVADCERRGFTSPWLSARRLGALPARHIELAAWSNKTKARQRGVDWQCRIENARVKLKRLYPKITA